MSSVRSSCDDDETQRTVPSFIEARPPLVLNPFMRPKPQKGKKLFDDLLEDSDSEESDLVQVYLRLKPCNTPTNQYEVHSERSLITSLDTTTAGHGRRTQHNVSKMYTFSHIFGPDSSQKEIFECVVKDNLKKLPDGNSFTLLTYGASGSGKTFTLMGTVSKPGLVPRSLEYVFKVVDAAQQPLFKPHERGSVKLSNAEQDFELKFVKRMRQISAPVRDKYRRMTAELGADLAGSTIDLANRKSHYVWVSFIEIYNEGIYDLLAPGDRRNAAKLAIREDTSGNVYVKGATQAFVRSGVEAYDVLMAGKLNLQVAATGVHAHSSRSHCIFTITMLTETEGGSRSACVRLCDLAGCERAARTRNTGARMAESRAINSSLHVLERCLRMLRRKRTVAAVVPYRESKLTRLLGAGLSGTRGEAVSMVVTLNPSPEYVNESRHVLQLAAIAKDIQINDTQFTDYPSTSESSVQDTTVGYNSYEMMKLRADNERLLFELHQAEARNKELMALIEEDNNNKKSILEMLEESKSILREYYEAELKALQTKMDEKVEEYERRLKELSHATQPICGDAASKKYQNQEISLEELDTCIDEGDENAETVISLTDSEGSDSEDDTYNESLEPTFRKEDINRSRLIRQSIIADIDTFNRTCRINESSSDESDVEKSAYTMKDDDKTCESYADTNLTNEEINCTKLENSYESDIDNEEVISTVKKATNSSRCTYVVNSVNEDIAPIIDEQEETSKPQRPLSRETYCVVSSEILNISKDKNLQDEIPKLVKDNSYKELTVSNGIKLPDINENTKSLKFDTFKDLDISRRIESQEKNVFLKSEDANFNNPNVSKDIMVQEQNKVSKSLKDDTSNNLNISNVPKLQEQNENLNLLKDDTLNYLNISKGIKLPEQNKNPNLFKGDNYTHLNISEGVELPGQNEISKSLKEDTFKNLNISKNIKLDEQNEVSKLLKYDVVKENDIFGVDKIPNYHKDTELKGLTKNKNVIPKILPNTYAKKVMASIKQSTESNNSLLQFERLEMETRGIDDDSKRDTGEFYNINLTQEKRKFFDEDCLDKTPATVVKAKNKIPFCNNSNLERTKIQHNLIKNSVTSNVPPEEKNKFLENTVTRQDQVSSVKKLIFSSKVHDSIDLFEELDSPHVNKNLIAETQMRTADIVRNSIGTISISDKTTYDSADAIRQKSNTLAIKTSENETVASGIDSHLEITTADCIEKQKSKMDFAVDFNESNLNKNPLASLNFEESQLQENCTQVSNTTEEFENIYKNISASRATEFDSLVPQDSQEIIEENLTNTESSLTENIRYNLRHKPNLERANTERKRGKNKILEGEILLESLSKCESKSKPTRKNLRLRRQKAEEEDIETGKLKDIVNLQAEFSDVTLDVPAPVKARKDIPSPEKVENEENSPPLEVQSCPAKSITRTRRKLFTPRAEPLEESPGGTGDSCDKVRVPRPSYHRPRARRKL